VSAKKAAAKKVVAARGAAKTPKPPKRLQILVLSGPNLQMLGTREPEIYGRTTLPQIHDMLRARGEELGCDVDCRQSNHEGSLCDFIAAARGAFDGILLNGAAYTHTSLALYDALRATGVPCVEVHLSNPEAREAYRRTSMIAPACVGKVAGFGAQSYLLGLQGLVAHLRSRKK
jgi:3-dehydroquinate dehydratase-2